MKNLTPEHMRCHVAECPSAHQLEDGRLLIVGAEAPTDLDGETVFETGVRIGQNEAGVIISPDLLSSLPEIVRLREENKRLREFAEEFVGEVDDGLRFGNEHTSIWNRSELVKMARSALSSDGGEG